jgi:hypothetical protein
MADLLTLAGEVYAAERAIWVWGMAKDIVLNSTAKTDFFNFCAAPKGDATKAVTVVFLDAKPYGENLMGATYAAQLRQFLVDAHSIGMKVEFLSGDKAWALAEYRSIGETLIDEVTAFNLGGTSSQRFDGIHYDVEPYLLRAKQDSDPLDWEYDKGLIWSEYLTLLTNCQTRVNTYNTSYDPDIRFGVAIPYWYGQNSVDNPQAVIDIVNYVAVMAYKDTSANIINAAQDEITYAASVGKKVYVAVETSHPTDLSDFPPSTTFYEEGNTAMETALSAVNTAFLSYSSYTGIAIHYYENLTGPRGKEISYRSLTTGANTSHYPVVTVVSPNRANEIFAGTVNIQWEATDLDSNTMTIKLEYSANGGTNWTTIANSLSNTGYYAWNTTGLTAGSNYLVRVTATDNSTSQLVGYDRSNSAFTISATVTQTDITDLHLWNESTTSLRLKWTPPNCTPRSYRIYRSVNGGAFTEITGSPVILVSKYIDTGLVGTNKYRYQVKAIYGNGAEGAISNTSNMLMPGTSFLIDYCEGNEGVSYGGPWGSGLTYSFDTTVFHEGTRSLKFVYNYSSGWGGILVGNLPIKVDISPYNAVKLWVKGAVVGQQGFAVKLYETGRAEGNEEWKSPNIVITSTDWAEYKINFSDFTLDSTAGNNRLDTHSIGGYGLLFGSATTNGTYNVDMVNLSREGATVTIPQSNYTFGTLSATPTNHRFRIGPIPITYSGYSAPWTIRIWTNNGGGAGLRGQDGVTYMPFRVWCANYGPTASVPDEEDDAYWVNNEVGWFRIPEYSDMVPSNIYTWRRLCWGPGGELTNPFDIYLAIDANGMPNQQYQTTTLTVEYINE